MCGRFSGEKRDSTPRMSPGAKRVFASIGAGEEPHAERAPRHEADPKLLARRDDFLLGSAPEHRVLVLDGGDRQRGMSRRSVSSPISERPQCRTLPCVHQVLDRAGDVLDRDLGIDPVLVEEVDAVGPQALEHPLDRELDVLGLAVEPRPPLTRLEVDVPAELGGDHDLSRNGATPSPRMRSTLVRAVRLGRIEERDAAVEGGPDDVRSSRVGTASSSRTCGSCSGRRARRWRPRASPSLRRLDRARRRESCSAPPAAQGPVWPQPPRRGVAASAPADSRKERRPTTVLRSDLLITAPAGSGGRGSR